MKLWKKVVGLVLGLSLIAGVALAAEPGDKGVSYKNNTAYCMAVEVSGDSRIEHWMLREGSQEDWDHVKATMQNGVVAIYIQIKYMNNWYHRAIVQFGWSIQDSGWFPIQDASIIKDEEAMMAFQYAYFNLETRGFEERGLWFTEYEDTSKAFVEHKIWAMAWKDYDEGQRGR